MTRKQDMNVWGLGMKEPALFKEMRFLDWKKAKSICEENPNAIIRAGLAEDWTFTNEIICKNGKLVVRDNEARHSLHAASKWATPIIDIDGKEIECWLLKSECSQDEQIHSRPDWWGD